jgi:D-alanyl-D-alanine carboxypeptidase
LVDGRTNTVIHSHNPEKFLEPASLAKMVLVIAATERLAPDTIISVPVPPQEYKRVPIKPRSGNKKNVSFRTVTKTMGPHATVCDTDTAFSATRPMPLGDAIANTTVASNLFTAYGIQRHLERKEGRPFADIARDTLRRISAPNTQITEGIGLSNAKKCDLEDVERNTTTAADMIKITRRFFAIPEAVQYLTDPFVPFFQTTLPNTNTTIQKWTAGEKAARKRTRFAPLPGGPIPGKTGVTIRAGSNFAGEIKIGKKFGYVVVLQCPSAPFRHERLGQLAEIYRQSVTAEEAAPGLSPALATVGISGNSGAASLTPAGQ